MLNRPNLREPLRHIEDEEPSCWSSCWKKIKCVGLSFLFITTPVIAGIAGYKIAGIKNPPFDPQSYKPEGLDLQRYNHDRCRFLSHEDPSLLKFNSNEAHVINYSYQTLEGMCKNTGPLKDYTWHNVWTYDNEEGRFVMVLGVWADSVDLAKQRAFNFINNSNMFALRNYGEFEPQFKDSPELCINKVGSFAKCEPEFVDECEVMHLLNSKEWPLGKDPKDGDVTKNPHRLFAKRDTSLDVSDEEMANSVFAHRVRIRP